MCQFGDNSKILNEEELTKEQALVGYRNWIIFNSFENREKYLKSINQEFLWPKKEECKGNSIKNNSEGIYNYNNNYYNYNYYNNYYDYNNYDYNNYYYYNNYNNNYDYKICGKTILYGKVFSYKDGYRSSLCIPTHLVILSDKRWFENKNTVEFANHFNKIVTDISKEYDCDIIEYDEYSNKKGE